MARVQVSDELWASFRGALGATPVNVALGQLVEREVARHRRRAASDAEGVRLAVDDARAVADELRTLIRRLEGEIPVTTSQARSGTQSPEESSDTEQQARLEGL